MPKVVITKGPDRKKEIEVAEGTTIQEVMLAENPETGNWPAPTVCIYRGKPLSRKFWETTALLKDSVVAFFEYPMGGGGGGGGGSNTTQMILQIAVIVVAAIATWYVGGTGAIAGISALGYGSLAGGLAGAAVMIGGSLLLGAIFNNQASVPTGQLSSYSNEEASPTYKVNGTGNQARLYQPEPEGFGRMKVTPDSIANTWAEYIDNEYYLYQVFGRGRGSYTVERMAFGDVTFWKDGAFVECAYTADADSLKVQLFEPGESVTLFPDNVEPVTGVSGQELLAPNASGDWLGPFPLNSAGTRITRGQLDITMPRGCGRYNDSGALTTINVTIEFQYRSIDDNGDPTSAWANCISHTFTNSTLTAIRKTFELTFTGGRYEIRGRRTSNSTGSDGRTMDVVNWEAAKGFIPGTLTYNQSGVAIRIKASNTLSENASNNFTLIQTRKLPVYDVATGTWSDPVETRSYAAGISQIIRAPYGGARADKDIDLDTLWGTIHPVLEARGWKFDCWIDGAYNVWQLVLELSQAYLVIPRLHGSVVSFALDQPKRPVRCEFTPYNIVRGSFKPTWNTYSDQSPDDVRVSYLDEDAGFATRDVPATLPDSESRKPAQKTYLGIVNRDHAYQIGMAYAARNRYRRLSYEFETEGMGRILNIGEVVTLNHPRLRDTAWGRVSGWSEDTLTIMADGKFGSVEGTDDLYVSLTRPVGSPWGPVKLSRLSENSMTFDAEDYALVISQGIESPFDWITGGGDKNATVCVIHRARTHPRRVIITKIVPSSLYRHTITCINDYPGVDDHIGDNAEPWQYRTMSSTTLELGVPQSVRGTIGGDAASPTLFLSWLAVKTATSYQIEVSYDGSTWNDCGQVAINAFSIAVPAGAIWARVRAIRSGEYSAWAVWDGDTTLVAPDAPVPALSAAYVGANLSIKWAPVAGDPTYVVRIFPYGHVDAQGNPLAVREAPLAQTDYVYNFILGVDDGGPWRKLSAQVVAVNSAGESLPGTISVTDAAPVINDSIGVVVTATSVSFNAVTVSGEQTGFVIARGGTSTFTVAGLLESKIVNSIPYTWGGLTPGATYYFRLAAKDAFFDIAGDVADLTFSSVITVTTKAS